MTGSQQKYWAFISYSHADEAWGQWLQKALERYRVPGPLVGESSAVGDVPRRLYPVFRDREELPTASGLTGKIQEALNESMSLVVICSPHAAASKWVNEEIRLFKAMGRASRVFCLIVAGEPHASEQPDSGLPEAFPRAVRFEVDAEGRITENPAEPLAADVRDGKDGRELARLKLVAGILGLGLNDLRRRDRSRRIRLRLLLAATVLAVAGVIGTVWWSQQQKTRKQQVKARAGELVNRASELPVDEVELRLLLTAAAVKLPAERAGIVLPEAEIALYRALEASRLVGEVVEIRGDEGAGGWIWPPVFDRDGIRLLRAGVMPTVLYGPDLRDPVPLTDAQQPGYGDYQAQFLPDGTIVTAGDDGHLRSWTSSGELRSRHRLHSRVLASVAFDPTAAQAVTVGCADGEDYSCRSEARLWDREWQLRATLAHGGSNVLSAAWTPDGERIVTAGGGLVRTWDAHGALVGEFDTAYPPWLSPESIRRVGRSDLILSNRRPPWRYAGSMFTPLTRFQEQPPLAPNPMITDLEGRVAGRVVGNGGSFGPHGRTVVSARGSRVLLRNSQGRRSLGSFDVGERVEDVAFDPSGNLLAVSGERTFSVWTIWGELIDRFKTEGYFFAPFARFNPSGDRLATVHCHDGHQGACNANTLRLWDPGGSFERAVRLDGEPDPRFEEPEAGFQPLLRYSPSGRLLFVAPNDGTDLRILDQTGEVIASVTPGPVVVRSAEFSADETLVRIVGENVGEEGGEVLAIRAWEWQAGNQLRPVKTDGSSLVSADWSSSGELATIDSGGRVRVWDEDLDLTTEMMFEGKGNNGYEIRFAENSQGILVAEISVETLKGRTDWASRTDHDYEGTVLSLFRTTGETEWTKRLEPLGTPVVAGDRLIVVECTDRFYGTTIGRGTFCEAAEGRLFDLDGTLVHTFDNPLETDWSLTFSAADMNSKGNRLLTVGARVRLWNTQGNFITDLPGRAAAFHPDGTEMAVVRAGGWIEIRTVWADTDAMVRTALARSVAKVSQEECAEHLDLKECAALY